MIFLSKLQKQFDKTYNMTQKVLFLQYYFFFYFFNIISILLFFTYIEINYDICQKGRKYQLNKFSFRKIESYKINTNIIALDYNINQRLIILQCLYC